MLARTGSRLDMAFIPQPSDPAHRGGDTRFFFPRVPVPHFDTCIHQRLLWRSHLIDQPVECRVPRSHGISSHRRASHRMPPLATCHATPPRARRHRIHVSKSTHPNPKPTPNLSHKRSPHLHYHTPPPLPFFLPHRASLSPAAPCA